MLIRFKKNDGTEYPQWKEKRLGAVLKERNQKNCKDGTYEHVSLTKEGVVPKTDRYNRDFLVRNEDKEYKITKLNDICYNPANLKFGVICRNKYGNGIFSPIYITFEIDNAVNPIYMEYFLTRADFINYALKYQQGTVYERMAVSPTDLLSINIKLPSIEEQQKIADFLSTVDQKIESQKTIVADYEELKKGTIQKIFNQEIRFKDDDGNDFTKWKSLALKEVFKEVSTKNHPELPVLSVAQGAGTVLRDASERRIMYDKSKLAGYKIVKKNDFIVHLRTFEGGLECSNHDGITSPAYRILRTDLLISDAFKYYFRSKQFIEQKLPIAVTGIRDGKNIDMPSFYEIQINVPCIEEQKKIADCLSALDRKIESEKKILADLEELKKGLLQAIFNN